MEKIKRVYKKEIKKALAQAYSIIEDLHKHFNEIKAYKFSHRLVGSAKWNIVLKDSDGFYDLDFQLLLTKNSNKIINECWKEEKIKKINEATMIKEDFFNYLNEKYSNQENYKVENSTTSITFINYEKKFSIDFVLIKLLPSNDNIIRRNNKVEDITKNNYDWNELEKNNEAYEKFKNLKPKEKEDLIENYILPKKIIEKTKSKDDPDLKSSSRIFKEEVNNYELRKRNN